MKVSVNDHLKYQVFIQFSFIPLMNKAFSLYSYPKLTCCSAGKPVFGNWGNLGIDFLGGS